RPCQPEGSRLNREIAAVLFDLDDTLCDTLGCRPERTRAALAYVCTARPDLDSEALLRCALTPLGEPRAVYGLRAVLHDLGLVPSVLADEAFRIYDTCFESLRLIPGAVETMRSLAGRYRLGLVSNSGPQQRMKLAHLGLGSFFQQVTISGEVGFEKP